MVSPKIIRQIDIAPTISAIFKLSYQCEGKVINEIVEKYNEYKHVVLIIIDALGYNDYLKHRDKFVIDKIMSVIYKCRSYSKNTTASIATILCGLKPEKHRIYITGNAFKDTIISLPEFLSKNGVKCGIVMESLGALSFMQKVDVICPINNLEDIYLFDKQILNNVVNLMKMNLNFIITHFRCLDKYGYVDKAVKLINRITLTIINNSIRKWLIFLCGDHPPHMSRESYVPLVVIEANEKRKRELNEKKNF